MAHAVVCTPSPGGVGQGLHTNGPLCVIRDVPHAYEPTGVF
jgi:hypothetical protein